MSPVRVAKAAEDLKLRPDEPGYLLGGIVLAILLVPILCGLIRSATDSGPRESNPVFAGLYAIVLGTMFLASYYFSYKSFLFRWFIWFCQRASFPSNRRMAFFYAALLYIMGTMSVLHGI